jgi:hypothetical protein
MLTSVQQDGKEIARIDEQPTRSGERSDHIVAPVESMWSGGWVFPQEMICKVPLALWRLFPRWCTSSCTS